VSQRPGTGEVTTDRRAGGRPRPGAARAAPSGRFLGTADSGCDLELTPGEIGRISNEARQKEERHGTTRRAELETTMATTMAHIGPLDAAAVAAARARQDTLTKPPGVDGCARGARQPALQHVCRVFTCPCPCPCPSPWPSSPVTGGSTPAGSPRPQEVTVQMVANITGGGAVLNTLARQVGASVTVIDVGVGAELAPRDGLVDRKVAPSTDDLSRRPAMTVNEALAAVGAGIGTAHDRLGPGHHLLVTGDLGIANITPSGRSRRSPTWAGSSTPPWWASPRGGEPTHHGDPRRGHCLLVRARRTGLVPRRHGIPHRRSSFPQAGGERRPGDARPRNPSRPQAQARGGVGSHADRPSRPGGGATVARAGDVRCRGVSQTS